MTIEGEMDMKRLNKQETIKLMVSKLDMHYSRDAYDFYLYNDQPYYRDSDLEYYLNQYSKSKLKKLLSHKAVFLTDMYTYNNYVALKVYDPLLRLWETLVEEEI